MSPSRQARRPGDGRLIAPSILSADFARLGEEIHAAEAGGAGLVHIDVMDGHFVPNITLGPPVVASLRKTTTLPLDCHLMISEPDRYVDAFIDAGADLVSVHQEAAIHLNRTLAHIRARGALAGVVINPATPVAALTEVLGMADYILVMSVNPGFGGQEFLPGAIRKVRDLKRRIDEAGAGARIQVDGGIGLTNARDLAAAGADWFVAGSAVFGLSSGGGGDDPRAATKALVDLVARA